MSEILLSEVVKQLRKELEVTMAEGDGKALRFEVENLELEMQVVVSKEASTKGTTGGGIKFWVVDAKASGELAGKYTTSQVQRLKLSLKPKTRDGGSPLLAG